jgi:tRNA(adenine34) deaminase
MNGAQSRADTNHEAAKMTAQICDLCEFTPMPASEIRVQSAAASVTPSGVEDVLPILDLQSDVYFMGQALREAHKAYAAGEVPVGAVIVHDGRIIARAWNQVETLKDATAHAEMLALTAAQAVVGDWRLEQCTLYVTKEPCPMCAGAVVHCRPQRLVFGCPDPKCGAAGSWINLLDSNPPLNHRCDVLPGVLGDQCLELLRQFFREARERKNAD